MHENAPQQRVMRVFVSSTFRDMQAERDELLKRVFPQLDKLCRSREVAWSEVDLRWGITDEQKSEGKVLPICLAEIKNRPFFIGLLGERYGWIPDEIPQELLQQEPRLAAFQGCSVTEIEIVHGVLNDPQMADRAFFYFRSSSYIESLPLKQQSDYLELPTPEEIRRHGSEEAKRRAEERRERLASLKHRIDESGLPVRDGYSSPQELGELVLRDLTDMIDRLYPQGSVPDMLEREASEHAALAASLCRVYIERPDYLNQINQHVAGDGAPLVVTGEAGMGKSALLANWAARYRASHPQEYLLTHFVGAFAATTDWIALVIRMTVMLGLRFNLPKGVLKGSSTLGEFRDGFAAALEMASRDRRIVLILDGLDHINDMFGGLDLFWLPDVIPPNARLILSTGPGRTLDALESRGWTTLKVEPLSLQERRRFINDYLAQFKKAISLARAERIAKARQTSNPLYLQTLLTELRLYGDHHTLDLRIDHYLEARKVNKLYEKILERYEQDYDRERESLVRDALSLLWAARVGLYEPDLLSLLGSDGEPLPPAYWAPLRLAAGESLMSRGGLLTFTHDYLRQAVQKRYLHTQSKQRAIHLRLADHLQAAAQSKADMEKVAWQLFKAKAWEQLASVLSDLKILSEIDRFHQHDLMMYWSQIEANSKIRIEDVYRPVVDDPARYDEHASLIALLLHNNGRLVEAAALEQRLTDHYRQVGDKQLLAPALVNQAGTLIDLGQPNQAMALLKQHEQICRELNDQKGLALSLGNQAAILMRRGELDTALPLLKKEEEACREVGDLVGVAHSLGNQTALLKHRGQLREALMLYQEQERIGVKYGLSDEVSQNRIEQAEILRSLGELDGATMRLKKEEKRMREAADKLAAAQSFDDLADLLTVRGEYDKALRLYQQQERLYREIGDMNGLACSLRNQGVMLQIQGDLDGAMALHKDHEQLARASGNEVELARGLGNQALVLKERGDFGGAMILHQQEEILSRQSGDMRTLGHSLANQANILLRQREADRALALHKEAETIYREMDDQAEIAKCLINQALILALDKGQAREALPLAEKAYKLASRHNQTALTDQIEPVLDIVRSRIHAAPATEVDIPAPHPGANPAQAAQRNIKYQQEITRWKTLPWWRRLMKKKPKPPKGI